MVAGNHEIFTNYANFGIAIFAIFCNFLAFSPFLCLNFFGREFENKLELLPPESNHSGEEKMKASISFLEAVRFFQRPPAGIPGTPEYNAAFCRLLAESASADAASIWQADTENRLHLVSSTDISMDRVKDITLRQGEGIAGAAALSLTSGSASGPMP